MQIYPLLRRNRDDLAYTRSRKASKFTTDAYKIIKEQVEKDDEMTGVKLQKLLGKMTFKWFCRLHTEVANRVRIDIQGDKRLPNDL